MADANATNGSTAVACCACPPGTVAAYADESLAFRFRAADGITRDSSGSLEWIAASPLGLAFVMNRTVVNGSSEAMETQDGGGHFTVPQAEPTINIASDGSPSGLEFKHFPPPLGPSMLMFANRTVAIGAKHTFFAVLTPAAGKPLLVEAIIGFRPYGYETGLFAWYIGNMRSASSDQRTFLADTWTGKQTCKP